jgi:hypothetical protein
LKKIPTPECQKVPPEEAPRETERSEKENQIVRSIARKQKPVPSSIDQRKSSPADAEEFPGKRRQEPVPKVKRSPRQGEKENVMSGLVSVCSAKSVATDDA